MKQNWIKLIWILKCIQMMANRYNANPVNQGGQPQEENHNLPIKLIKTD